MPLSQTEQCEVVGSHKMTLWIDQVTLRNCTLKWSCFGGLTEDMGASLS